MNNLPEPYSARFHEVTIDNDLNVTNVPHEEFTTDKSEHDRLNNEKLLQYIKKIPFNERSAYFEVCFAIAKNGIIEKTFSGYSYGYISSSLQEQIANDRIIKFGYSNGIKANAWNIPSAIQLPMKLPN